MNKNDANLKVTILDKTYHNQIIIPPNIETKIYVDINSKGIKYIPASISGSFGIFVRYLAVKKVSDVKDILVLIVSTDVLMIKIELNANMRREKFSVEIRDLITHQIVIQVFLI